MCAALRILHLEDNPLDVLLIGRALRRAYPECQIKVVADGDEFLAELDRSKYDLVLSDSNLPHFSGLLAKQAVRARPAPPPFLFVCGYTADECPEELARAAGDHYVSKTQLDRLRPTIDRVLQGGRSAPTPAGPAPETAASAAAIEDEPAAPLAPAPLAPVPSAPTPGAPTPDALSPEAPARAARPVELTPSQQYRRATELLVAAVQELSLARDLPAIMQVVRRAARELTGADGATFVLRDGECCFYAEENAIAPLWKGRRFPLTACISGWAMLHRHAAVIEDIYADPRVPADAYRPTFVRSLAMVPIRTAAPVGAIGNYWAATHRATDDEVRLLQALADSTSIAMENVQVYAELEARVRQRTAELQAANQELEAFSYSVSHDLRAPLRAIDSFSQFLEEESAQQLDAAGRQHLAHIRTAAARMGQLIEDLLRLSRVSRTEVVLQPVDLSQMAHEILDQLQAASPERTARREVEEGVIATADPRLVRVVLENLLSNAWKYSSKNPQATVWFGRQATPEGPVTYYVRDNGAGFDMQRAGKLFTPFQRLHSEAEFPGTGVGLATVQRVVQKHGGRIWAESQVGRGATFSFTLDPPGV